MGSVRVTLGVIAAASTVLVASLVAGCVSNENLVGAPKTGESVPSVIVPGGPGEPARIVPGDQVDSSEQHGPTEADFRYVEMMIPHHQQALEMTALVPERVVDQRVRLLAERIEHSQGPEINAMRAWLERNGRPWADGAPTGSSGHGSSEHGSAGHGSTEHAPDRHDHGLMPGMATPEQMAALAAARGTEFDRMFLELMIAHHQGAVEMAHEVLAKGRDVEVLGMAQDVAVTQTAEIERMREMLAG